MGELPYISKNLPDSTYTLHFKIPVKEYNELKSKLSQINKERFEKIAKSICEEQGIKTHDVFPRFKWSAEGELESIAMGVNCACVSKGLSLGEIAYSFHNIDWADQALAALQILSTFYNALRDI